MPTRGHEGNDAGHPKGVPAHPHSKVDAENPGYEVQDINVGGIATFIAGLAGFILIFFVFCFFMGKAINYGLNKQDGPANLWHKGPQLQGGEAAPGGGKGENMASNAAMEQKEIGQMASAFPTPRLETDDGNQDIADLHAREDLLLDNYSSSSDLPSGAVRIPIEQAMALVVQRGLSQPAAQAAAPATLMAGEQPVHVQAPLTNGFARTGYELDTIESRNQKLEFEKASEK